VRPTIARSALALAFLAAGCASSPSPSAERIPWEPWSDAAFERAKREHRFVLLDLEAVWCHWCHVMDETTYRDPAVVALITSRYVAVRVDQDSRPDISNRYEDYGWPATVVFDASGGEIVKRSGYIPPPQMASMLQAIVDDPTPGPSVAPAAAVRAASDSHLDAALRARLLESHVSTYDAEHGGWGFGHKYLDPDCVELSLALARTGDVDAAKRARQTLDAERALIDPVWGGVYQYSTGGDWKEPHFEKIMAMQAGNLECYALAFALWRDPSHSKAAGDVRRFLRDFLTSPEGAFYTSQDADLVPGEHSGEYFALDDAGRRARGVPRVDSHVYARENGWAIRALVALHDATGDANALDAALRSARWIGEHRALPGGGFRHDETDVAGPYLGDTLAMGRAFLALYGATADRAWLSRAEQAAAFVAARFRADVGFATAASSGALPPSPERDENVALARFANLLFRHTGNAADREIAEHAMRYLAAPEVASRVPTAGVLLADLELGADPPHVTIVGRKDDPKAKALFEAALAFPSSYRRIEWFDRREGPLPNADVEYPELEAPAAFVCSEGRCSSPAYTPEDVRARTSALP
jgi:uncharacterized protein